MAIKDSPKTKTFCRTELINKLIVLQYSSEIKYLQVFQHLLTLENELYKTETVCYDSDVFTALFNKWMLRKEKKSNETKAEEEQDRESNNRQTSTIKSTSKVSEIDPKDIARQDSLHRMLSNVRQEKQYLKLLKNLYSLELSELTALDDCVF